ncbi:MAG: hypothetical protein HY260_00575 [Chloroflexi bacterium]|nr:hypothetical protein [Chloroflexota bacterium]
MSNSHPVKLSPISAPGATLAEYDGWRVAERFTTVEAEMEAAKRSVALSDLSARGKILIQGREAPAVLQQAFGSAPSKVGEVGQVEGGLLACLTRDEWYLVTPVGGEARALERIDSAIAASGVFAHATDLTHARGAMMLAGPHSREVLAKLCGLDFHASVFPNRTAAQSGLAKVAALIVRDDLAAGSVLAYQIHVNRSEADYVWGAMLDAASEFGGQPVGVAAMAALAA